MKVKIIIALATTLLATSAFSFEKGDKFLCYITSLYNKKTDKMVLFSVKDKTSSLLFYKFINSSSFVEKGGEVYTMFDDNKDSFSYTTKKCIKNYDKNCLIVSLKKKPDKDGFYRGDVVNGKYSNILLSFLCKKFTSK